MSAISYVILYHVIVVLLTFVAANQYVVISGREAFLSHNKSSMGVALLLTVFLSLFIGLRPQSSLFVDMMNYLEYYNASYGNPFYLTWDVENKIFDNIFYLFSSNKIPIDLFFLLIASIYFGCMYIACKRFFPKDTLLALLVCLAAFSTFSYGTNGIKSGAAASIFLVALSSYNKKLLSLFLTVVSIGFHHSMIMVAAAYVVVLYIRNPKYYFYFWFFSLLMAALHVSYFQMLFAGMSDESGAEYLRGEGAYAYLTGFRLDFILYSSVPFLINYYLVFKKSIQSETVRIIANLYAMTNAIWMLCMYASFTNRIAYLSWFMHPIALISPFLLVYWSPQQIRYLKYAVYGNLAFTLFMEVLYHFS